MPDLFHTSSAYYRLCGYSHSTTHEMEEWDDFEFSVLATWVDAPAPRILGFEVLMSTGEVFQSDIVVDVLNALSLALPDLDDDEDLIRFFADAIRLYDIGEMTYITRLLVSGVDADSIRSGFAAGIDTELLTSLAS